MKKALFGSLALYFILTAAALGHTAKDTAPPAYDANFALADIIRQKFTGDFEAMIKRRLIRVLVAYSETHYFVDRGAKEDSATRPSDFSRTTSTRNSRQKTASMLYLFPWPVMSLSPHWLRVGETSLPHLSDFFYGEEVADEQL